MPEYPYSSDASAWLSGYLWEALVQILDRVAPPPERVFELGAGNGATARMLAARGYSVTAVDPSASGIAIAKRSESERLRFELGSTGDDLAGTYGRFPVVLSLEVIEHCHSANEFMTAFASVMEPGGVGIISTPYHGYLKNLAIAAAGRFDRHVDPLWEGGHLRFYSHAKLAELFRSFGFTQYEFRRAGRVPPFAKSTFAVIYR